MRLVLPSRSADHASATKRKHAFILVERRRPRHAPAVAQQESMAADLGLLLDPVARQRPAGMERIAVAAERMPRDRQGDALLVPPPRPDKRRAGKEWVRTCRCR